MSMMGDRSISALGFILGYMELEENMGGRKHIYAANKMRNFTPFTRNVKPIDRLQVLGIVRQLSVVLASH